MPRLPKLIGLLLAATLTLGMTGCVSTPNVPPDGPASVAVSSSLASVPSTKTSFQTTISVAGATLAKTFDATSVILSDGFEQMTVTAVEPVSNQAVTLTIVGDFAVEAGGLPYSYGTIGLAPGALDRGDVARSVRLPISHPGLGVVSEAMTYENGTMVVYLGVHGAQFSKTLTPQMFSVVSQGKTIAVKAVERTYAIEAKLSLAMTAVDLDDAIGQLRGGTVTADADALTIDTELSGPTTISVAHVDGFITLVDADAARTRVKITLEPVRGYFDGLTPQSLVLGGDFSAARDVEVSVTDSGAVVSFSLPGAASLEDVRISGSITLADGVLKNMWGSDAYDTSVMLRWASGDEPKGIVDTALGFWSEYGGTISSVASFADTAFKVAGVAKSALEMFGVIEGTNAKIDKVYNEMNKQFAATHAKMATMQADITNLVEQTRQIRDQLTEMQDEAQKLAQKTADQIAQIDRNREVGAAAGNWGSYYRDLRKLENLSASFRTQVLDELFNIVKNDTVTVDRDTRGTVAVEDTVGGRGRTNTGYAIDRAASKTYKLPVDFVALVNASGKVPERGLTQLQQALTTAYGAAIAQDIMDSIALEAVYVTAKRPQFNSLTTMFTDVATTLGGSGLGNQNPLYYHDIAVEAAFNWDPSTHPAKNHVRLYISTVLAEAAMSAVSYLGTVQSNSAGEIQSIMKTLDGAATILKANTGYRSTPSSVMVYNTHARQPLTIVVATMLETMGVWQPYGYRWDTPWVRLSVELNRIYMPHRASFELDGWGGGRSELPELFAQPVLAPIQIALMAHSARARGTTFQADLEAVKLGSSDASYQYTYPKVASLYMNVKMTQSGTNWSFTGDRIDADGRIAPYSRQIMRQVNGKAEWMGDKVLWAFFTATLPA